jgi:CRP/FNR family transcriptional regulator, cyclic AMP receptor protein
MEIATLKTDLFQRASMAKRLSKRVSNGRARAFKAKATYKGDTRFDPAAFLANAGLGRAIVKFQKKQIVFSQGDEGDTVFYVQRGKIRLTVASVAGKEATIALLSAGDFLGEGCIVNAQHLRMSSAVALTESSLLRIDRKEMISALHKEHTMSDIFVAYLLARNLRVQADLVDQLFNSSEKRLARTLLLLAQFGKEGEPETVIPKISQETLAGIVGTTRARVNFFLNRFRKLGFIEYNGHMQIHRSLLSVVLHD